MITFTHEELRVLHNLLNQAEYTSVPVEIEDSLFYKVRTELDHMDELENMDLSDCAGGACKL